MEIDIKNRKRNKGLTLIEFGIYIALSSVLIYSATDIGLNMLLSQARFRAMNEVTYNANFVLGHIQREARNAKEIVTPDKAEVGDILEILTNEGETVTLSTISNAIWMQRETDTPIRLSSDAVKVENLQFNNLSSTSSGDTLRVTLEINYEEESALKEFTFKEEYYSTVHLRNQ